jgi:molybdate transport repressor ModE-like protein
LIEIRITPVWTIRNDGEQRFDFVLVVLLQAIRETGRLTDAAKRAGISYRHAWNLIEKWGQFLGAPLVEMTRGRGTKLTPLGEKLLWAGQRFEARLTPQLENLSAELAGVLNETLKAGTRPLRIHASHDFAVARLRDLVGRSAKTAIDLQYRGSIDALASLYQGGCDIAGFHIAAGPLEPEIVRRYTRWLKPRAHRLIRFVTRTQGFIVVPGNPKRIATISDLARSGIRFVNRQVGSGTRTLLEHLLAHAGIDPARIAGFEHEELTHAAVGALVAGRVADVGFGVRAAADQFGLDFVPMALEHYYLICRQETLTHPTVVALRTLLRSARFGDMVAGLAGYAADRSGEVVTLAEVLPGVDHQPS